MDSFWSHDGLDHHGYSYLFKSGTKTWVNLFERWPRYQLIKLNSFCVAVKLKSSLTKQALIWKRSMTISFNWTRQPDGNFYPYLWWTIFKNTPRECDWLGLLIFLKFSLCLLAPNFVICWWSLQAVWIQIRPDRMSGLIWIQTDCLSESVPDRFFLKSRQTAINACKITQHAES